MKTFRCSRKLTVARLIVAATRHHQFRVNMTQDYELLSISQDNPQLITYIREVHLMPAVEPNHKPLESSNTTPEDTVYVLKLLNNKVCGFFSFVLKLEKALLA